MVLISHKLLLTNPRPLKTMAWYSIITSHYLSHTCTGIGTIRCPFSPPGMMVWPADAVATSERHTEASGHARARLHPSHQHAAFAHATHVRDRWDQTTPPLQSFGGGVLHQGARLLWEWVQRTCDCRCVRLCPRVSRVWFCVTNIWTYSREGGGISSYAFTRTADSVQSTIKPFLALIDILNRFPGLLIWTTIVCHLAHVSLRYTRLHVLQPLPPAARYLSIHSHMTLLVSPSALFLFVYSNEVVFI